MTNRSRTRVFGLDPTGGKSMRVHIPRNGPPPASVVREACHGSTSFVWACENNLARKIIIDLLLLAAAPIRQIPLAGRDRKTLAFESAASCTGEG